LLVGWKLTESNVEIAFVERTTTATATTVRAIEEEDALRTCFEVAWRDDDTIIVVMEDKHTTIRNV